MSLGRQIPLGTRCPDSPHAVVSSLPTMADVIGYEEKHERVVSVMKSGYPRFVTHIYVRELLDFILRQQGLTDVCGVLFPSEYAVCDCLRHFKQEGLSHVSVDDQESLHLVYCDAADSVLCKRLWKYVQHTGFGLSSRQAEDLLIKYGELADRFPEIYFEGDGHLEAVSLLSAVIGCKEADVSILPSGMSAFYAGFQASQVLQCERGRHHWIQLGWLYLDSGVIMEDFRMDGVSLHHCYDVTDLASILSLIDELGDSLAGVVVECPTNPLVQVCDLKKLYEVVSSAGGVVIVDPTVASVYNVNVLPYCDLLVSSLTKYAGHEGDVMLGALALNASSAFYEMLSGRISGSMTSAYSRDVDRLAYEMQTAEERVRCMNRNALALANYLGEHPAVARVRYASDDPNYEQVARSGMGGGGLLSFELVSDFGDFYDQLQLVKGPSFGTDFSILCPFMYLAHYDLVTSKAGREQLQCVGISPNLLRYSAGVESVEDLERTFANALSVVQGEEMI